jgi:hypothetical protein
MDFTYKGFNYNISTYNDFTSIDQKKEYKLKGNVQLQSTSSLRWLCLVKKVSKVYNFKGNRSKLVSTRRSTVLTLSL